MADENLQYQLTFKTRAEGTGAKDTTQAVRDLAYETDKLNRLSTPEKVKATQTAYYDLSAAIQATSNTSAKAATHVATVSKAGKNYGMVVQQAGYQVQDFAVQVAAGGNAVNAFIQQGSQMAGIFGPGGAVAGGLLALGGIAYNVFKSAGDGAEDANAKAEEFAETAKQIAEAVSEASAEDIDFALGAITAAKEEAEQLLEIWKETNAARAAADTAALSNAEILRQALVRLAQLRGYQIEQQEEIRKREEAQSAQRQLKARQEIDAANEKNKHAQDEVEITREQLEAKQKIAIKNKEELERDIERLEVLRKQKAELEKQAAERIPITDATLGDLIGGRKTATGIAAEKKLADQYFQSELANLEQRVVDLQANLGLGGKIAADLAGAAHSFSSAMIKAQDIANSVAIEIPRIEQTLNAEEVKGKVTAAAAAAEAVAEEIKAGVEGFNAVTDRQKAAKADLESILKDNEVSSDEIQRATNDVRELMNSTHGKELEAFEKIIGLLDTYKRGLDDVINKVNGMTNLPMR